VRQVLVSSPKQQAIGQSKMASSCIRGGFLTASTINHWNGLPRDVVEAPPPEVFIRHTDVEFRDLV